MSGPRGSTRADAIVLAGRYELVHHIARGGMADVFEAVDRQLDRPVAVKRFRSASPQDRSRFEAEVLVLARLNHPHLVQVYDAGEHDGESFVVMELVDGPSLQSVLETRVVLPARDVASMGAALADALSYVHEEGIVHRDVTPANVLCGRDGRARLADFGIARLIDTSRITATATTIGTAAYMAPEQLQGHDVTPAADVYSLGLVLLEALMGRPGFEGTSAEVAVARLARDPDTTTDVPAPWAELLTAMTAREPAARPSAATVRGRLRALALAAPPDAGASLAPGVAGAPAAGGGDSSQPGRAGTAVAGAVAGAAAAAAMPSDPGAGEPTVTLPGDADAPTTPTDPPGDPATGETTVPVRGAADEPTVSIGGAVADEPTVPMRPSGGAGAPAEEQRAAGAVDGLAETTAIPVPSAAAAQPPEGGTTVMPAVMRPEAVAAAPAPRRDRPPGAARPRHLVWGLIAGLVAAALIGLIARSGGGIDVPSTTTVTEAPPSTTTTLVPTTTTAAPAAAPAAPAQPGGGGGEGKGKGNGDKKGDD